MNLQPVITVQKPIRNSIRCRLCTAHCPPNNALWNRDIREKLQDVVCEWIAVDKYHNADSVCDTCRSTIEEFYRYKKSGRKILQRKQCVQPVAKQFKLKSSTGEVTGVPLEAPGKLINGLPKKEYFKRNRVRNGLRYDVKCYLCDAIVARRLFDGHLNRHNGLKPYSCPHCGDRFPCKQNLSHHTARNHADDGEMSCVDCGLTFTNRIAFVDHRARKHTERRHVCKVCGLKWHRPHMLKNHMRIHSAMRDLVCHLCGKTFKWKMALSTHLRTHTGEAPYACHVCIAPQRRFVHRNMYVNHMRQDHPGEPIARLNGVGKRPSKGM